MNITEAGDIYNVSKVQRDPYSPLSWYSNSKSVFDYQMVWTLNGVQIMDLTVCYADASLDMLKYCGLNFGLEFEWHPANHMTFRLQKYENYNVQSSDVSGIKVSRIRILTSLSKAQKYHFYLQY